MNFRCIKKRTFSTRTPQCKQSDVLDKDWDGHARQKDQESGNRVIELMHQDPVAKIVAHPMEIL